MEPFLVSTGIVALGEIGDKTQLLALLLAARFRRPVPIIVGILVATLLNHALAGLVGDAVARWLGPDVMRWVIGLSFLVMAGWMLVPDEIDDADAGASRFGVFGTTLGMMIANVPAVLLGDRAATALPMKLVHAVSAAIFAVLGVLTLLNVGRLF